MNKKRISNNWYKVPRTLRDVTLIQFIDFNQINQERTELLIKINESPSNSEQTLLHLIHGDIMDRLIVSISNIPYSVLSKLEDKAKSKVYSWFEPIFEIISFKADIKAQINQFKFKGSEFFLFEFGTMTAKQMLWLETYWKEFYKNISSEIANMNFEELPRLIAITAFKKNEINTLINDDRTLPLEIKPAYYERFTQLVEERTEQFKELPLSVVYGCLNFFFANSTYILQTIQTSTQEVKTMN